jgi:hypothetical protein
MQNVQTGDYAGTFQVRSMHSSAVRSLRSCKHLAKFDFTPHIEIPADFAPWPLNSIRKTDQTGLPHEQLLLAGAREAGLQDHLRKHSLLACGRNHDAGTQVGDRS